MTSIKYKLGLVYGLLALVLALLLIGSSYIISKDSILQVADDLLLTKLETDINFVEDRFENDYGKLSVEGSKLISESGEVLNDNHNFVDKLEVNNDLVATIFLKDNDEFLRITTNLKDESGNRMVGTTLDQTSKAYEMLSKSQSFYGQSDLFGTTYQVVYRPIISNGNVIGSIFIGVDESIAVNVADRETTKLLTILSILLVVILVVAVSFTFYVGDQIAKPMINVQAFTQKVAQGDLNVSIEKKFLASKTEIGSVAKSVVLMRDNLKELISNIQVSSEETALVSEEIKNIVEEATRATNEVTIAVGEIAQGANIQASDLEVGRDNTIELGTIVDDNHELNLSMKSTCGALVQVVDQGVDIVQALENATQVLNTAQNEILSGVNKTNNSTDRILEASELIDAISSQTNLLALNASIEAARAGEHGKGFAVVADEIRKLAEQSRESNAQIQSVIEELKDNSDQSVENASKATIVIGQQVDAVKETLTSFTNIKEHLIEVDSSVDKTHQSSKVMNSKKETILESMNKLSVVAQQSAATTEETSASVHQISAGMEEIVSKINNLVHMNLQLDGQIRFFKLD